MNQNRIWIYQLDRVLSNDEASNILDKCNVFCDGWNAHGNLLDAKAFVKYNSFVVLSVNESAAEASGCSIDSSVHFLKKIAEEYKLNLFDRLTVAFLVDDKIQFIHSSKLDEAFETGKIESDSLAFNNTILTENELESDWLIPLSSHWSHRMINSISKV